MADFKKLTINLSLFSTNQNSKSSLNSTSKSPRNFENSAIVGLGIVAAMNDWEGTRHQAFASANSSRAAILAITSPRSNSNSNPIPIIADSKRALMEFSDSCACVISHLENCNENTTTTACMATFRTSDFLNFCFLCEKKLQGLDIFMYRGEKAFCSAECRSQHIASDDHKGKCGSGVMNPLNYSISPCSGPLLFFAGVAAA